MQTSNQHCFPYSAMRGSLYTGYTVLVGDDDPLKTLAGLNTSHTHKYIKYIVTYDTIGYMVL